MTTTPDQESRRRCETNACDIDGTCTHCGALNGEVCRDHQDRDENVLQFSPKPRKFWPSAGSFDGGSAA